MTKYLLPLLLVSAIGCQPPEPLSANVTALLSDTRGEPVTVYSVAEDTSDFMVVALPATREQLLAMLKEVEPDALLLIGYVDDDGLIRRLTKKDLACDSIR